MHVVSDEFANGMNGGDHAIAVQNVWVPRLIRFAINMRG